MTSFKMLLLFFLHLIKYSQRNVIMSYNDYIFFVFPYISYFCFMYLATFQKFNRLLLSYFLMLLSWTYLNFVIQSQRNFQMPKGWGWGK